MKIKLHKSLESPRCFLVNLMIAAFGLAFLDDTSKAQSDPRKIMEGVYNQDTSRDTTFRANIDFYDKKGSVHNKQFILRKIGSLGKSKTLVRFTEPAGIRGVGVLSINEKGTVDRQWMYTPANQRVRRIAAQERRQRFIGTDFTNEDMAERVLDDYTYKLVGEGEVVDGRKTHKIEARPVSADKS